MTIRLKNIHALEGQMTMGSDIDLAREVIIRGGVFARWFVMGLQVIVKVSETREAYGRLDAHISPVGGGGSRWIASEKLDILTGEEIKDLLRDLESEGLPIGEWGGAK